jgi:hypothetical protein
MKNHEEDLQKLYQDFTIKGEDCYDIYCALKKVREEKVVTLDLVNFLEKLEKHVEEVKKYREDNCLDWF